MFDKGLSAIDLLGIPVILNFARAKKVRSGFGGFWSLAFLGFVIWAIYNSGHELFAKEKPQIIDGTVYSDNPRPVEISTQTAPVALKIRTEGFNISSIECSYQIAFFTDISNISDLDSLTWNDMETCTYSHFDGDFDKVPESTISTYYCIPKSLQSGPITGFLITAGCSSPDPNGLSDFLQSIPIATLYYPKYGITLQNYKRPTQRYMTVDQMTVTAGIKLTTMSVTHFNITTDDGWLTRSEKTSNYIKILPSGSTLEFSDSSNIAGIFYQFIPEREELFYTRSYTKIQDVLADVGGLAGSVLAVLLIVITPYARIKLSEAFVNEMFEIKKEKGRKNLNNRKTRAKKEKDGDTKSSKYNHRVISDAEAIRRDNSQTLEMAKRDIKDGSNTLIAEEKPEPVTFVKTENNESPYRSPLHCDDESPLVMPDGKTNSPAIQAEYTPTSMKENELDYEEGFRTMKSIRLEDHKCRFEPKNPFLKAHSENERTIKEEQDNKAQQDLENQEGNPARFAGEGEGKEDNGQEEVGIEVQVQNDDERDLDPNKDALESQNNNLRKEGVFGVMQLALPKKPKKIKKPKTVSISIFEYLKSFIYQSESTKEKMKILNEGIKALDNRLDVFNLLKKLRDIDKMKGLIFDKDQQFLLDQLPRPEIMKRADHWFQEEYLSYHEISKDSNDFDQLRIKDQIMVSKQRIIDKSEKTEIDEKLLHLI